MMRDDNIVREAISAVRKAIVAFCKFTSANDAGSTGAHQAGYYMPKNAWNLMFNRAGTRGENMDRTVIIKWQNDFETQSRFIYYGQRSRNEYRLTRFGRGFPFLTDDNVGDLLVLCHMADDQYEGYVLSSDEDIEAFLNAFGMSPVETNALINKDSIFSPGDALQEMFQNILNRYNHFPATADMASYARDCFMKTHRITDATICNNPDKHIISCINTEYELFKAFETKLYTPDIKKGFKNTDELIAYSNQILNRRKSRAGKSLEHHLSTIFSSCKLRFETQVVTEAHKKPDFIFPGGESYHNPLFPPELLICLGAKTTCKDRWRQILNEANRTPIKHLFTLQQGISKNQLTEMYNECVCLVVPAPYIKSFDESFRDRIMTLTDFIQYVKVKQS